MQNQQIIPHKLFYEVENPENWCTKDPQLLAAGDG